MAYLKNIIRKIEKTFGVHIHGISYDDIQIENVQYLFPSDIDHITFQAETLYVGKYMDFHHVSLECNLLLIDCRTDNGSESSMYIYQNLDPFRVCNCIQQELFDCHKANLKKEEMFHVLQAGYGIQSILDTARTYLNNPITLCTTGFSVLAISPKNYVDDKFDLSSQKKYLQQGLIQNMKDLHLLDHIFNSHRPITKSFDDSPGVQYIFCSVHIKNAAVGYLCVNSSVRDFTAEDSSFITELSKMIAIEMQKDDFYAEKSGIKYEYFLTDLIEQNFHSVDYIMKRMSQIGQKIYHHFWVIGFVFYGSPTNQINPKYYIDQLTGFFPHSMAFFYKGNLILLHTSNHSEAFASVDRLKLYQFLQFNQMYFAISYRYQNILDTYQYYNQVLFLLDGIQCMTDHHCISYYNNYLHHLIESTKTSIKTHTLIHPDIHLLIEHDKQNHTEYIHTLRTFFENNRNVQNTSTQLHIHKSTFFYRIGKISELTSFEMNDAEMMFTYEFSFKILNFMSANERRH